MRMCKSPLFSFGVQICLAFLAKPALGSWLPAPGSILSHVDNLMHSTPSGDQGSVGALEVQYDVHDAKLGRKGNVCILKARGTEQDDGDGLERAVKACGRGGMIRLPSANYTIARPLDLTLHDAYLDIQGWISYTADTGYWISHHIPWAFQNQSLGLVIRGNGYVIDGNGRGGINGNGQVWYDLAKDEGNMYGRPITLAFADSTNVHLRDFSILQPQFWALVTINSSNIRISNYYVNATSSNPESWRDSKSWLQNTDGVDTYTSHNVTIDGMVYQGGDDCIALKANSTGITARNVTCVGGTGIAFGSVAQYAGVLDIIEDVHMEDLVLTSSTQCLGFNGVYFKSWVGEARGTPPNGGGGGHGYCRNVTVRNVRVEDIRHPIVVQTEKISGGRATDHSLIYLEDQQGKQNDNGLFEWSDIHLSNFTGHASANRIVTIQCSKSTPCQNWTFEDIGIEAGRTDHPEIGYVCNNIVLGGRDGLNSCHPSDSKLEMGDPKTKEGYY